MEASYRAALYAFVNLHVYFSIKPPQVYKASVAIVLDCKLLFLRPNTLDLYKPYCYVQASPRGTSELRSPDSPNLLTDRLPDLCPPNQPSGGFKDHFISRPPCCFCRRLSLF